MCIGIDRGGIEERLEWCCSSLVHLFFFGTGRRPGLLPAAGQLK
jgi:hypothetical protein